MHRIHKKTWLEIDEINEENLRMVQNKAIKSIYDVEGMGENKNDKIELIPPIYSQNKKQTKERLNSDKLQ